LVGVPLNKQKHSIMSLKKKSKSLGHLTALGSHPCSPDVEPKLKKNGSSAKFNMVEAVQPTAAKYMKRFLSPTSQDRQPLPTKQPPLISSPMNMVRSNKIDKQLQTRNKTTPKVTNICAGNCRILPVKLTFMPNLLKLAKSRKPKNLVCKHF